MLHSGGTTNPGAAVPVTAKLSKLFYDRLGEQIADELVTWFNDVDATYRSDLKDLNELNFARFDAKLEQRLAEQDARIDRRFAEADVRVERRFAAADVKLEQRFAAADVKLEQRFAAADARLTEEITAVRLEMGALKVELIRWMFVFWLGAVGASALLNR